MFQHSSLVQATCPCLRRDAWLSMVSVMPFKGLDVIQSSAELSSCNLVEKTMNMALKLYYVVVINNKVSLSAIYNHA